MHLQRQNQKQHDIETVLRKIKGEHAVFKHKMLSGTVQETYDFCRHICFYESLREYFLYKECICREFLEAARERKNILEELWKIYLKDEYLKADTWEEIEILLQRYARKHAPLKETEETI